MRDVFLGLLERPDVAEAFDFLERDRGRTLAEQMEITAIRAPSHFEQERAADYLRRFEELGLCEVRMDEVGNVLGVIKGSGKGPTLVVAAHTDTVFGMDVDCTPEIRDGIVYAPGIADDARGLAEILTIARAIKAAGIRPAGDIVLCGDVCEESMGNLKGMKHLFAEMGEHIDGFLSIDLGGAGSLAFNATGSVRYKAVFSGEGGHSFGAFGTPNSNHAAGRAVAKIADIKVPDEPRTTFNVGVMAGGTGVSVIPATTELHIDMRSNEVGALKQLEAEVLGVLSQACDEENARWGGGQPVALELEQFGSRPAGLQPEGSVLPEACAACNDVLGIESRVIPAASTDCNVPISLGIPAAAIGFGGSSKHAHSAKEQYDPTDDFKGPQRTLLLILGLVGVTGGGEPLLPRRG